jgi:hypothetical protein
MNEIDIMPDDDLKIIPASDIKELIEKSAKVKERKIENEDTKPLFKTTPDEISPDEKDSPEEKEIPSDKPKDDLMEKIKKKIPEPSEETDEDSDSLIDALVNSGVKKPQVISYIVKNYRKKTENINDETQKAKVLFQLLKKVNLKPNVISDTFLGFFNSTPEDLNVGLNDNVSAVSSLDSNELIEVPIKDKDGNYVRDANGQIITIKMTKSQLYWQTMEEKTNNSSKNTDVLSLFQQDKSELMKILLSLYAQEKRKNEQSSPFDTIKAIRENASLLGLHEVNTQNTVEVEKARLEGVKNLLNESVKTVTGALKDGSPEIRSTVKDFLSTIKELSEIDNDFKKTKDENLIAPNIPQQQQEELFRVIHERLNKNE